ncbi:Crp/Fnr family transcriptional regulator [Marimonas sp. MJW-29]|uniref:Crp/Fnr family transcriptional regulator n=1 Tax=Sulfitobacter sediminis TaxID=3234186 RepID=A0ABV3RNC6_9RHOB
MFPSHDDIKSASERILELFSAAAREVTLDAHKVLFEENDLGDSLFIVLDGSVEISLLWHDGRRLSVDVMRAGHIFGEIALFDPGVRTATARTLEPSRLAQLTHDDLLREASHNPSLALELLMMMGKRMRWMNQQLHEYVFMPLPARLARKLLYLMAEDRDGARKLTLSQTDLADFAGATREAVSKILSTWSRQGILKTSRGSIELLDRSTLFEIAGYDD